MPERVLSSERIYPGDVVRLTISVVDPDDGTPEYWFIVRQSAF